MFIISGNAEQWVCESNYTNKESEMTRLNGSDLHSGKKPTFYCTCYTQSGRRVNTEQEYESTCRIIG